MNIMQCAPDCLSSNSQHQQKSEVLALSIKVKELFFRRNLCVKPRSLAMKISSFLWFILHNFLPIPVNTEREHGGVM